MRSDIAIAIPSKHRPAECAACVRDLFPSATVWVDATEVDTYVAAGVPESSIRAHQGLCGLAQIRIHIIQNTEAETVVMIDDDIQYVSCWVGRFKRVYRTPAEVLAIVYQTAQLAMDAGVRLFCWGNNGKPLYYKPDKPINFVGPAGRALGVVGKTLRWDERLVGTVDTDATLQALLEDRIILCDTRYYFHAGKIYGNKGGAQAIRTKANHDADKAILRDKWGSFVDVDGKAGSGQTKNAIRVKRKAS